MTYDFGDVDDERRRTMEAIPSEGTAPEEAAKAALDGLGVSHDDHPTRGRYRPDFVLEDGTVLQIHGAFWHGHPDVRGMDEVETNEDYWSPKLRNNMERDRRRRQELLSDHDAPMVVWVWEVDPVAEHVAWHCRRLGLIEGTEEHWLWSKVEKSGFDDCWEWQAGTDRGYGHFRWRDSTERAHRAAYELWYGRDPGEQHVLHDCDNQICVNPRHLHLGSHEDNMREAWDRGLQHRGEGHGRSKLDEEAVRDIKKRHSPYGRDGTSARQLADEYDVSPDTVRHIIEGETWGHVE